MRGERTPHGSVRYHDDAVQAVGCLGAALSGYASAPLEARGEEG